MVQFDLTTIVIWIGMVAGLVFISVPIVKLAIQVARRARHLRPTDLAKGAQGFALSIGTLAVMAFCLFVAITIALLLWKLVAFAWS